MNTTCEAFQHGQNKLRPAQAAMHTALACQHAGVCLIAPYPCAPHLLLSHKAYRLQAGAAVAWAGLGWCSDAGWVAEVCHGRSARCVPQVVGATNQLQLLDEALLRPGRFDRTVYMGRPSTNNRFKILQARHPARHLVPAHGRFKTCLALEEEGLGTLPYPVVPHIGHAHSQTALLQFMSA